MPPRPTPSKAKSAKATTGRARPPKPRGRAARSAEQWQLRLYIAGQTPRAVAALANLKRICATHLDGRYSLEVVDLLENPRLAQEDQILAIPTLVRKLPPPVRKIIGNLSDELPVLVGLQLRPRE